MTIITRSLDKLSIVVPCLNEQQNIVELFDKLKTLNEGRLEIIFVDDGSVDSTWKHIESIIENSDICVIGIKFTKNFGKEAAIEAGLNKCTGNAVITMDADLEHPVEVIPKMIELWNNNQDVYIINAVKENRQKESLFKRICIYFYFKIFSFGSGIDLFNNTDFKLLDIIVVKEYINLPETRKFYRGLVNWLGYNSINIPIKLENRPNNQTSWNIFQLIKYAKHSILSFTYLPLKSITWLGVSLFLFSVILSIDTFIKTINGKSAEGFPTVIILILGVGSVIIFSLGLIGEYLAEIYNEVKGRPKYVSSKTKETTKTSK